MGLFSRIFGKKKVLEPADLSALGTDVHSHFIPGIDDGAPDLMASLELVRAMSDYGYKKVITTPHVMSDYYRNTPEIILGGLTELKAAIVEAGIPIEIEAAAEYYCDEAFEKLVDDNNILSFGNNYVLFELGFMSPAPNLKEVLFKLQLAGYKPVLAHPERYPYWFNNITEITDLYEKGVLLQLNINSLTGTYGPEVQDVAEQLVEKDVISFLGSDCHHPGHLGLMQDAIRTPHLHQLLKSDQLLNASL